MTLKGFISYLSLENTQKVNLFSKRSFVFVQKQNAHGPYIDHYQWNKKRFSFWSTDNTDADNFRINSYDNAILYEDYLLDSILIWLQANIANPTYFYFISDHGQVLGEKGLWGHCILDISVTEVPFIFDAFHTNDTAYLNKIKNLPKEVSWYEVGLLIAEKLGWIIQNPNNRKPEGEYRL